MLKLLRSLNQPLVLALVAAGVARAVLALGGDPVGDPLWSAVVAVAVGVVAGLSTTDSVRAVLRGLDPKLVSTIVSAAITRLAVEVLGIAEDDPLLQAVISLAVATVAGWLTPNVGTIARTAQESGNGHILGARE